MAFTPHHKHLLLAGFLASLALASALALAQSAFLVALPLLALAPIAGWFGLRRSVASRLATATPLRYALVGALAGGRALVPAGPPRAEREPAPRERPAAGEGADGNAIVEWSSDGVVLLDPSLTTIVFNRSAVELTGRTGLGRPCREVLRCRDATGRVLCDTACPARRSFAGERLPDRELRLLDAAGRDRWVSASFAPVAPPATADGAGVAPGEVVVVLRDITGRKAFETMQNEFVASVSHELRAPLASIKAYTEILLEDAPPQSLNASFLATIDHETDYLTGLIDNLLNVARIESGRLRPQPAAVYLAALVAAATPGFAPQMAARELTWDVKIADDLPPVYGDKDLLTILLKNLIANAIKYNRRGGSVIVEAEADPGGGVRLTVGDEGIGLAPAECARVFDKFYRVASTTQSGIKGSGLGLYLVRQIAALHGGAVTVASAPDVGSLFTVTLSGALADAVWE